MPSEPNLFDPKILVVDDDPENLTRYLRRLGRLGYTQVTSALSAKEMQIKLEEEFFDLIVADMRMEAEDSGFVIIEEVKRRKITSVVIILTANDTVEDCRRAFKAGAWDYIAKGLEDPFETLHQSIQEAVEYLRLWEGSPKSELWINENIGLLRSKYSGKFIAVMNDTVFESADTREDLEQSIKVRKLPLFATAIKKIDLLGPDADFLRITGEGPTIDLPMKGPLLAKLTIFVEGPTDVFYIKKAAKVIEKKEFLESITNGIIHLDTISDQQGQDGGGYKNLVHSFNFLKNNPGFRPNKVLFLFDHDVKDGELPNKREGNVENLYIRRMGEYDSEQRGIEWFFAEQIFEEGIAKGFVNKIVTTTTQRTGITSKTKYEVIGKKSFCDWLCTERENKPEDFASFVAVFAIIEEILKIP